MRDAARAKAQPALPLEYNLLLTATLCLLVEGSLDEVERELERAGVVFELGPVARTGATGPIRSLYLRDPDGNLVELSEPI